MNEEKIKIKGISSLYLHSEVVEVGAEEIKRLGQGKNEGI